MAKYNISKEYGIFTKFIPPFNRLVFKIASLILGIIPKTLKSDENVKITKKQIKTVDEKNINIYIFEPLKYKTNKVLLYIHGGGFVFKGCSYHYNLCKSFAKDGDCKVVYVDYRLAPKYKYPIPLEDCYSTYKWIIKNANELEIDKNKIIIAGDSAGGCLAVDVTLKSIEEKIEKPCYQLLIYPVLDKRNKTESMKKYTDTPMWNSKLNKKMWKYYLQNNNYISPNERNNLYNISPTYIETAQYDCLHDEAKEFAKKLKESKVNIILNETKGTMHGYDIKNTKTTKEALLKRIEILKNI